MIAGPFLVACGLLVVAGVGKILQPAAARAAVVAAGLRVPGAAILGFGIVEVAAAAAGAILGGRAALGVAVCYLLLTAFAVRLLVHAPATPCGCLGSPDAVITRTHVALNVVAAGVAVVAAASGAPRHAFGGGWLRAGVFLTLVACCVRLAALALETLPALVSAVEEGSL